MELTMKLFNNSKSSSELKKITTSMYLMEKKGGMFLQKTRKRRITWDTYKI